MAKKAVKKAAKKAAKKAVKKTTNKAAAPKVVHTHFNSAMTFEAFTEQMKRHPQPLDCTLGEHYYTCIKSVRPELAKKHFMEIRRIDTNNKVKKLAEIKKLWNVYDRGTK